mgnify:FL=1
MVNYMPHEGDDQDGVYSHSQYCRPFLWECLHDAEEKAGDGYIYRHAFHGIVDGVLLLAYDVTEHHSRTIPGKTAPGACHVTVLGDEDNVHGKQYGTTSQ